MIRAFTLVEIMIVVAIVVILVVLAAPNILRSRMIATEGGALANLKTLSNACQLYNMNKNAYPTGLSDLISPNSVPSYIDTGLATGSKQGYNFIYNTSGNSFSINADPTGIWISLNARYFYVDQLDVVRARTGGEAGPSDAPI